MDPEFNENKTEYRISNKECRILKFFTFDIHYSLFDLPAMPLIRFEIAFQMFMNDTVIIAMPSTCMAGGYSAVLFSA